MQRMRSAQPPLRRPALDAVTEVLLSAIEDSWAAWAYAVQTGAYEQVVRCMDAYAGDAGVQVLCCGIVLALGHKGEDEFFVGHAEAAVRAGAVRSMVSALRTHGARRNELFTAAARALASVIRSSGAALEIARDGRAAEALARGLPLALRAAAETGDTLALVTVWMRWRRWSAKTPCARSRQRARALWPLWQTLCACTAPAHAGSRWQHASPWTLY